MPHGQLKKRGEGASMPDAWYLFENMLASVFSTTLVPDSCALLQRPWAGVLTVYLDHSFNSAMRSNDIVRQNEPSWTSRASVVGKS